MEYIELSIKIESEVKDITEIISAELAELGFESFQEEEGGLNAYIPSTNFNFDEVKELYIFHNKYLGEFELSHTLYKDKNWNEYWEKNFQPVLVENQLLIRAPFYEKNNSVKHEIILEPKMSFGTGHHATTYLVLQEMMNIEMEGKEVLDIGCGTGILSIFAHQLNASRIVALDNNEWAYKNALENFQNNGTERVETILGDINSIKEGKFDIILANINRNVILAEIEKYTALLKKGGTILLSGILKINRPEIEEAAEMCYLSKLGWNRMNGWVVLDYKKM